MFVWDRKNFLNRTQKSLIKKGIFDKFCYIKNKNCSLNNIIKKVKSLNEIQYLE